MKFVLCLLLFTFCLISAEHVEQTWGNVNAHELGVHRVEMRRSETQYTVLEFTYPEVPSEYPIVGLKQIDYHSPSIVEFINGQLGDHQLTLRVIAEGHEIVSDFIFYVDHHGHH